MASQGKVVPRVDRRTLELAISRDRLPAAYALPLSLASCPPLRYRWYREASRRAPRASGSATASFRRLTPSPKPRDNHRCDACRDILPSRQCPRHSLAGAVVVDSDRAAADFASAVCGDGLGSSDVFLASSRTFGLH